MEEQNLELVEADDLEAEEFDLLSILVGTAAGIGVSILAYKVTEHVNFILKKKMYEAKGIEYHKGDYMVKVSSEDGQGYMRVREKAGIIDYIPIDEKSVNCTVSKVEEPS